VNFFQHRVKVNSELWVDYHLFQGRLQQCLECCAVGEEWVNFGDVSNGRCFGNTEGVGLDEDLFVGDPIHKLRASFVKFDLLHCALAEHVTANYHMLLVLLGSNFVLYCKELLECLFFGRDRIGCKN